MSESRLSRLPLATRRALALLLAVAAIAYFALLVVTYLKLTSPSSISPDLRELDRLLFRPEQPKSRIERLLESTSGEIDDGSTMRPAFTDHSTGWQQLTKEMTEDELATLTAQREGERLALLDWVRSGASRAAFDRDDHPLTDRSAVAQITPEYIAPGDHAAMPTVPSRVRIRSLITDRCVTCHGENGRHDTARFISLDGYDALAPRLVPEDPDGGRRAWLVAALTALFPLAALAGPLFCISSQPPAVRSAFTSVLVASLLALLAGWLVGRPDSLFIYGVLAAAVIAAVALFFQIAASLHELGSSSRGR